MRSTTRRRKPASDRHPIFARLYFLQAFWEPLGMTRHRKRVGYRAEGDCLEIGAGTGFSFKHYASGFPTVVSDTSFPMMRRARKRAARLGRKTTFVVAAAEALPFRDQSLDTIISQSVLCSVDDPAAMGQQVSRVLRPEGSFRTVEHGVGTRPSMIAAQRAIRPVWLRLFGGCHPDRDVISPFVDAGLTPDRLRRCSAGTVVRATYKVSQDAQSKAMDHQTDDHKTSGGL